MKVMMIRKADEATEKGEMPSEEMLQAMADYNEKMLEAGVFVSGEGLRPSRDGVRIQFTDGKPLVIDGPFSETKELLAGFSVLQVDSMDEAIEWAKQWPGMDSGGNVALELRRYYEIEDFEAGPAIDKHQQLDSRRAALPDNEQ